MTATEQRIQARWRFVKNNTLSGADSTMTNAGLTTYSGSAITDTSRDFQGDWRSADSWQRFDLWRVRNRSRQLQRGNPACIGYGRAMRNNVLGCKGFHLKVMSRSDKALGDTTDGALDTVANAQMLALMKEMALPKNFTTRKILSEDDADKLLVTKLVFDGEIIIQKRRGFANDFGFAWQIIDPDYLDHNLNRIEPNGNITKMGVELDATDKFPVAYWFLHRRPNDYIYNYAELASQRYYRVPAEEIFHLYIQTDDNEQTRGWPWIFASMINLFRAEKFAESALINAVIGASKGLYYTKEYPEGFAADGAEMDDQGYMFDKVAPGTSVELPYGVKPVMVDTRYPDAELQPFMEAMSLGMAMTFGTSYATATGDLSKANFVSSRLGQKEEQEFYMSVQEFFINRWKIPAFDEQLYRAMLARKINLPLAKFDKFNAPKFTGRRWDFVQPVDEMKAMEMALNNRVTSISAEIEKRPGNYDADEVFLQIAADEKRMKELGFERITGVPKPLEEGEQQAGGEPTPAKPAKKAAA